MRLLAVGAIVLALTIGYLVMLSHFNVSELPRERHFAADAIKPAGEVYIYPIGIDALNEAMQVRATLEPTGLLNSDEHAAADRDLRLVVTHDKTVEEINLPADQHIAAAATFEVDLNEGSVAHYPVDSYRANLSVQLFDGQTASLRLPVRVTV
jgi:Domain of unknown function (DUF4436)